MKTVLEVYKEVLERGNQLKELMASPEVMGEEYRIYEAIKNDIFYFASLLEQTEEVNPTKTEVHFHSSNDFPNIGEEIEKDGKKWIVEKNEILNVTTAKVK